MINLLTLDSINDLMTMVLDFHEEFGRLDSWTREYDVSNLQTITDVNGPLIFDRSSYNFGQFR